MGSFSVREGLGVAHHFRIPFEETAPRNTPTVARSPFYPPLLLFTAASLEAESEIR